MEKRNLYIFFGILAILAVALVLNFSNFTGFSVGTLGDCVDSDYGLNYYELGAAHYTNRDAIYTDYCYAKTGPGLEKWVREYYCNNVGKIDAKRYLCENGCQDGACIK